MIDENRVNNIDYSGIESKRIRTIGYKQDGNTPCKHFYTAFPLDAVMKDERYSGLYIALIEKAYQDGGNDYNGGYYGIFDDLGGNIFRKFTYITGYYPIEGIAERIDPLLIYKGKDGYLNYLSMLSAKGWFVKNPDLMILDMWGMTELAEKYRVQKAAIIAKRQQEEQERRKAYIEKCEAEKKAKAEEKAKQLKETEDAIRAREEKVYNTDGVILDLMRKHDIDVPLRTQGWILDCLYSVNFADGNGMNYSYYRKGKARGSQSFFKYMWKLVNAIDNMEGAA